MPGLYQRIGQMASKKSRPACYENAHGVNSSPLRLLLPPYLSPIDLMMANLATLRFEEPVGMAEEFPLEGLARFLLQGLRFLLQG